MNTMNDFQGIRRAVLQPIRRLAIGGLVSALLASAGNSLATTYVWTNNTVATGILTDPNAWDPIGGPGGAADTFQYLQTGTYTLQITNDVSNVGSFQFGAANAGETLNLTLDFGTNTFAGLSGDSTSASGFVFGQTGTSTYYIAVGKMYCTNAAASPSNARLIIGRNSGAPASVFVTNGTVVAGNLVIANNAAATPSKLVISGPNSFWSNQTTVSIGNASGASFNSIVISNSGSMVALGGFNVGSLSGASFNSVVVDSGGRLVTKNAASNIGATDTCSNNTVTITGGGVWDNGGQNLVVGNASGAGNSLIVGASATVSNVLKLTVNPGSSLSMSGGTLRASSQVNNSSATIQGFGTIDGGTSGVSMSGNGTISPGVGNSVGKLTIVTGLGLGSDSTTILKLDRGQADSNDFVVVGGGTLQAGTLTFSNVGAPLLGGDTFKVLSLNGGKFGEFGSTNLPSLNSPLLWNTTQLGPQGIISVVLPTSMSGPVNQAVLTNTDVVISTVTTGVPFPGLRWRRNGVNLTDGATGNGSSISGSTSATLTIFNAQTADSGVYCLGATNFGGAVTNCMTLTVAAGDVAPTISGPTDQNVIVGQTGTFSASVSGLPLPTQQWQENGIDIPGATNAFVSVANVQFAQDGYVYSIIASNSEGMATNSAVLHVIIPPIIAEQPQDVTVTNTQSASFTVLSTNGVPAPTYQWYFYTSPISGATNPTYTIASATPALTGLYHVVVANIAGSATSADARLTVLSTMTTSSMTPSNGATGICYDTPLYLLFDRPPVWRGTGTIKIYNVTDSVNPVDTIDTAAGLFQSRTIAGESFKTFPVLVTNNLATIYPHLGVMTSNQTYYVTVDQGTFADTNGALFAGITDTNAWRFTTKPTGPANQYNIIVAADNSADFCTVQGAVDSLPSNNTTYALINIRNGDYNELVSTRYKSHITFRGQTRKGVVVGCRNNDSQTGGTHFRMAFKVYSDDIAIENMTVTNRTPKGGSQAEALMLETNVKRFIFNNADVASFQDTILGNTSGTQAYFKDSLVLGDTDFIWGAWNAFFTNCEIRCVSANSHITQARTDAVSNGMSFVNCRLTKGAGVSSSSCDLGRTLGFPNGNVIFMLCHIDNHITGWSDVSWRDWEYINSNLTDTAAVSYNGTNLPPGDVRALNAGSVTTWLYGWNPQLAPNIIAQPTNLTVYANETATFTVGATGIPDPSYQWLKNGTNILGATMPSLIIVSAQAADTADYSVIVSNASGSVTSDSATLTVITVPATASFLASPTNGFEPLAVTFTDTSTGSEPLSLTWDLGDTTTTNTASGASFVHTYAAGTYTVTLTASNSVGTSTLVSNNLITAVTPTPFEAWQLLHFGCTDPECPQAAATSDPDGDGLNNMAEFLAGTDPNSSASALRITSAVKQGNNVVITWATAGGHTNVVQAAAGGANGSFTTNNFVDIAASTTIVAGTGDATTNYTDVAGATNAPTRFYRVRLVP
jgi:pectin methylesterase-like acyl-CoA thioesterase/PKD repeat protein